jgi:hypothetical protein
MPVRDRDTKLILVFKEKFDTQTASFLAYSSKTFRRKEGGWVSNKRIPLPLDTLGSISDSTFELY